MFSKKLRELRESRGLSQGEFAARLGIAVTTYRNYENTSRQPSYEILVKIAQSLHVSVDYLLDNDNSIPISFHLYEKITNLPPSYMKSLEQYIDYLLFQSNQNKKKNTNN